MAIDNHGRASRALPFPLQNALAPEEITPAPTDAIVNTTADFFPSDPDEKIDVVFNLSFNEFTAIASSIDIGRDIGYGDNSTLVWWIWIRSLIGIGGTPVSCDDVADCIESEIVEGNTSLIDILTQNSISTGTGGNYNRVNGNVTTVLDRNPPRSLQESINPEFQCDLDKLWGGIRHGIVERLDDSARDLLEDLAAINDLPQRFQAFIDVIPVLGDIAEGVVTLATEVIPDILNLYNSYSSEAILDEISCDLFALVCEDCQFPTFEQLYNYYATLGYDLSAMDAQTLAPMMQKIGAMIGTFQPSSIVYHSMITFQLFVLYLQAEWNGNAGISTISKWARLGEDFGSNNWLDLCETCGESYTLWTYDFTTQGKGDFYADTANVTSQTVFEVGKGWRAVNHSSARRMDVAWQHDPAWKIRAVAVQLSGTAHDTVNWIRRPNWGSTSGQAASSAGSSTPPWTRSWEGYAEITGINEIVVNATFPALANSWLEKVSVLYSTGFAPSANTTQTNDLTPYSSP